MFIEKNELIFLVIVTTVTIGFHLYDFGLPPLWADETSPFIMALSLINSPDSDLYNYSHQWGLHLGPFPVAWQIYNGNSIASFIAAPILYFFGTNVLSIRIYEMLIAIILLSLTYFCGKELFSKRVGMISVSLLAVLPSFVFYSRQSALYDWSNLCIALLVIIFGLRYLKTTKNKYLFLTIFLIGIGVYEYLWFGWIVVGFLVTIPLWFKNIQRVLEIKSEGLTLNSNNSLIKIKNNKIKFAIISVFSFVLGFSHMIVAYILSPKNSLIVFLLNTIQGNTKQYLGASNTNFLENLTMRGHDVFDFLGKPNVAFYFANIDIPWNDVSFVFPILFLITTIVSVIYVAYRKDQSKRIASLLLLILGIFVASTFTVSTFLVIQMSIMLPFIFLSIGKGIDIIASNKKILNYLFIFSKRITIKYIIFGTIVIITLTQIPLLVNGFDVMENTSTANTIHVYEELNFYMAENNLKPVSFDFFTAKIIPFYSNGEFVPVVLPWELQTKPELNKFREPMTKIENLDFNSDNYVFIIYAYPSPPDCSKLTTEQLNQDPVCFAISFVEKVAIRDNAKLEIIDFMLPDGTSFIRTMRIMDEL